MVEIFTSSIHENLRNPEKPDSMSIPTSMQTSTTGSKDGPQPCSGNLKSCMPVTSHRCMFHNGSMTKIAAEVSCEKQANTRHGFPSLSKSRLRMASFSTNCMICDLVA